jgi:hypothetical protein
MAVCAATRATKFVRAEYLSYLQSRWPMSLGACLDIQAKGMAR